MDPEQVREVLEILREFGSGPASQLLAAGVRAHLAIGWGEVIVVAVMVASLVVSLVYYARECRGKTKDPYATSVPAVFAVLASIGLVMTLIILVTDGIPRLCAPEWYAVGSLIGALR